MSWRVANSLTKLRDQVNAAYPNRNKASDGTIGDASHQAVASDHNPNAEGVVCALDLTHDPANGFDAHATADRLIVNRHPNVKYIISNRRIAGSHNGWVWQPYYGSNPHSSHIHVSVGVGADGQSRQPYDDTTAWAIDVSLNQVIGGNMSKVAMPDRQTVINYFVGFQVAGATGKVGEPTEEQIKYYTERTYDVILSDILNDVWNRYVNLSKDLESSGKLPKGTYLKIDPSIIKEVK